MDDLEALQSIGQETPDDAIVSRHRAALRRAMGQSPPAPATVAQHRRWWLVAAASLAAVVVGIGVIATVGDNDSARIAAPAADPGAPGQASAGDNSSGACGSASPLTIQEIPGVRGPLDGPRPAVASPSAADQLVQHWLSDTGSIEMRWPAGADVASIQSAPPGGSVGASVSTDSQGEALLQFVIAVQSDEPTCQRVQFDVRDEQFEGANELMKRLVTALGPQQPPLVVRTEDHDELPPVVACSGPAGPVETPNLMEQVEGANAGTPGEALQAFLLTQPFLVQSGYVHWHLPDGTAAFVQPRADGDGFVTVVHVSRTDNGEWYVDQYEASSC